MRYRTARGASTAALAGALGAIAVTVTGAFAVARPAAAEGEVSIEVSANGEPADSGPGASVESGATVEIGYSITVGSLEPLYDFVVVNLTGDLKPDCDIDGDGTPDGTDGHPGPLSAGDSFSCVATVTAGDPGVTYASVGRVTAYDFDISRTFVAEDVTHYTALGPTTTQPPTAQAPSTVTTTPSTTPPTSASSTTSAAPVSTVSTTAPSTASTSSSSTATTTVSTTTSAPSGGDAAPPAELAATDDNSDGFPVWWVVLAFGIGGAMAVGIGSHFSDTLAEENATVPDQ